MGTEIDVVRKFLRNLLVRQPVLRMSFWVILCEFHRLTVGRRYLDPCRRDRFVKFLAERVRDLCRDLREHSAVLIVLQLPAGDEVRYSRGSRVQRQGQSVWDVELRVDGFRRRVDPRTRFAGRPIALLVHGDFCILNLRKRVTVFLTELESGCNRRIRMPIARI